MATNIRIASTQHRNVAVTIDGKFFGYAKEHKPGTVKNNAKAIYPGGSSGVRILSGVHSEFEEDEVTFLFDAEAEFWMLDALTKAVEDNAIIEIVDTFTVPGGGTAGSRKSRGVITESTDHESSAEEPKEQEIAIKYIPAGKSTS